MLWSLQYPLFYIAQGDIICYNGQILPIADVHVLNLQMSSEWRNVYKPFNTRGSGDEPYCNGNNAGNCQPSPFLGDTDQKTSTCSAALLDKFFQISSPQQEPTTSPTAAPLLPPSSGATVFSQVGSILLPLWIIVLWLFGGT